MSRRVYAGLIGVGLLLTTGCCGSRCCARPAAPAVVGSSPICCPQPCCGPAGAAAAAPVQAYSAPYAPGQIR